jgi:hypothetical protein
MGFKTIANARELSGDGRRLDVVGHEYNEETECVWGGFDGEVVYFSEGKIGLEVRIVGVASGELNEVAQCDASGTLTKELVMNRLPVSREESLPSHLATPLSSPRYTYNTYLQSYLNFCKIQDFPIEPTPDTLIFFVVFLSHHIKPSSVAA